MFVSCPRCNQQNYPNATQCAYCGTPLSPSMIGAAQGQQQPPFNPQASAPGFAAAVTGTGNPQGQPSFGTTSQPQAGQLIDGKYRVERVLGEGGMGIVYVALDVNADQRVVIKSIRPEFANRGDFRERTLSEGKALAKIDHQNVVRFNSIINSAETNELYIVMQYIEGESLDRTLEKANAAGQKLPVHEVMRVFKQILDGVGAAHKEGLMHRDLKPANVLVRAKDGVAKVMDFGISKAEGATKGPTQAGGIVGSLWYMAPEQIKGAKDLDKRLDIYALGIVMYELVTGVVPFDGDTEFDIMSKHMSEPVPSVRNLRPDAPPWIDEVIQRATQKDRNLRFSTCEEMRGVIDGHDGGISVPRSATAYDQNIAGTGGYGAMPPVQAPSGPGAISHGTAAMGAAPQHVISIPPTPPQYDHAHSGSGHSHPGQKKSSLGLILGVVGVLAVAGAGAGWYFTRGDESKVATKPSTDVTSKPDQPGKPSGEKPKKPDADKPPKPAAGDDDDVAVVKDTHKKKNPLDRLVGKWKSSDPTRSLEAVRNGDVVEFHVLNPAEFGKGVYQQDEIRFSLELDSDGKTYDVVDRLHPNPNGFNFTVDGLKECLVETRDDLAGNKLKATLKSDDALEVIHADPNINWKKLEGTIIGCNKPTADSTATRVYNRVK